MTITQRSRIRLAAAGLAVVVCALAVAALAPSEAGSTPSRPGASGDRGGSTLGLPAIGPTPPPPTATAEPAPPVAASPPGTPGVRTTTEVEHLPVEPIGVPDPAETPLSTVVPPSATAAGALVPGFPSVIALPAGSTVVTSSVDSSDAVIHAAADATTAGTPASVIAHYRAALSSAGLSESPVQSAAGSTAVVFSRGASSVTIMASTTPFGCAFSLFAVIQSTP